MSERVWVIMNPHSGSAEDSTADEIREAFGSGSAEVEFHETSENEPASSLAAEAARSGVGKVAACGGDGTVMSAVNGIGSVKQEVRPILAIVPTGTANLLATALGVPSRPSEAVEVALRGDVRNIDLGWCNDSFFALGVGTGLLEKVISATDSEEKDRLGKLAYVRAILRQIRHRKHLYEFDIDGGGTERQRGVGAVVANASEMQPGRKVAPDASIDDGLLELYIMRSFAPRDIFRLLWGLVKGDVSADPGVVLRQFRTLRIDSSPPSAVQVDGEEADFGTPLEVRVLPKALRVMSPRRQESERRES